MVRLTSAGPLPTSKFVTGETDLQTLLATMRPCLSDVEFAFGTVADPEAAREIAGVVATFVEDEGLSLVGPAQALARAGIVNSPGWAKITLTGHSSLAAVGLTATIASALAKAGISANVIAAYHHDHVFTPWEQREQAMAALSVLQE